MESHFIETMNLLELLRLQGNRKKYTQTNKQLSLCSRYGFAADKLICLGFIHRPATSEMKTISSDYILSKDAVYQIDIAGKRFGASPHLHAPSTSAQITQDKYKPTAVSYKDDISH